MVDLDKVVGLYHFISDRTPKDIPLVEPKPRTTNCWRKNGHALIARAKAEEDIRFSINQAIDLLGGLERAFRRGDKVLVKPNFNSPDSFPASTDLAFLRAIIELLLEAGARAMIGESSGGLWRPSKNVFRKLGVYDLARSLGVELVAFEESDDWVRIKTDGDYLSTVTMPRSAYEADRMVYLPCMKTHNLARFSGALKLAVGFVHPGERRAFHLRHLQQKIAEISLCWQPDLIVMDGRKAFVSGGPDKGEIVEPGILLASGDLVAIDIEAMKLISSYQASRGLPANPCQLPQISTALKHDLGCGQGDYVVLE